MHHSAYPEYRNANTEWLGGVPAHWKIKRLKIAARLRDRKVEADPDEPMPYVGLENIESWTGRLLPIDDTVVPAGTANAFEKTHTLFGKLRPYLAKACNPDFDGLCSTELLVLQPADLDRRNLLYSLLSDGFIRLVDSSTFGSKMPRANWQFIGNCVVPIPPAGEQQAIADFLDRETARLDTLVGKKRELIERLKEKRTALISRTVTRGLPAEAAAKAGLKPHPKLKPSGIEWLGDIPENWEVTKMRCVCSSIRDGTHNPPDRAAGIHRLLSVRNVQNGKFFLLEDDRTMTPEDFADLQRSYSVEEGDIVLAIVGATTGKSAIVEKLENVTVQRSLAILRPIRSLISSTFLNYVIRSAIVQTEISLTVYKYSAQPGIYLDDVSQLPVVRPSCDEQTAIADYLDRETAKIDKMMEKVEGAIEKLQEYRTALITAAVTGKIDVRGEANSVGSTGALAAGTFPA